MVWSDPFFSLIQSRVEAVHGLYSAATGQMKALIDSLENLIESPPEDLARHWAAVQRTARNVSWSEFARLEFAQSATKRARIQALRLRIQNFVDELVASPSPNPTLAEQTVIKLHAVRNEFCEEEQLAIQSWGAWSAVLRMAGATVGMASIVGMLFLLCWSGLATSRTLILSPLPESGSNHTPEHSRQVMTRAIGEQLTKEGPIISLPSALSGPSDSPGHGPPGAAPFVNPCSTRLFDGAWETEILNCSHLWSEYVGIVVCQIELVSPKPFPWDEVFPDTSPTVSLHFDAETQQWWIENHGHSPVLLTGEVLADKTKLKTMSSVVLRSGATFDATSNESGMFERLAPPGNPAPPPPEEGAPKPSEKAATTPPVAEAPARTREPTTAPSVHEQKPATPTADNLKAKLKIETITGNKLEQDLDADIVTRVPKRELAAPCAAAPAADLSTMVAALLGKAPNKGDDSVRVVAPLDLRGIRKSETRSVVVPVNKNLASRGVLAVRAECNVTESGIYKLSTSVNGRQLNTIRLDLIGTDLNIARWGDMSVDDFRFIQRGMKDVLEYKDKIKSKSYDRRSQVR